MSDKLTIYDAEYWAFRYLETYSNSRAYDRLCNEVSGNWGESLLARMMEHWKKLGDQLTRPVEKINRECVCAGTGLRNGKPCLECSGESKTTAVAGPPKPWSVGSNPASPAIDFPTDHLPEGSH